MHFTSPTRIVSFLIVAALLTTLPYFGGCASSEPVGSPPFAGMKPQQCGEIEYRGAKIPLYEIYSMPVEMHAHPDYPDYERRKGVKGEATLDIVIDQYGGPVDFRIVKTKGSPAFGKAAVDAAAKWHYFVFKDANGRPIVHALHVNMVFEPNE